MARVIVDTWFAAHKGQVSDEAYRQRRGEWGYAESEQGWRRAMREANGASTRLLVATVEDKIIAVAASEVTAADFAEVGALYVGVPYQRSGIGRRLLEAMIDHYRSLGISTLRIAVLDANGSARRFYESLGGRKSGTREDPDGPQIVYAWDLAEDKRNTD